MLGFGAESKVVGWPFQGMLTRGKGMKRTGFFFVVVVFNILH